MQEGEAVLVEALPIFGQPAASVEPADGAFDDPTLREYHEALGCVGSLDDLHIDLPQDTQQSTLELWPLVASVGIEFQQEWVHAKQGCHHHDAAIAVLDVRRMHDGVQQQALRVYQEMALLALDLLARVEAWAVNARSPFPRS